MQKFVLLFLFYVSEGKNSFFCPSKQKWNAGVPYKTISEDRPAGKYMMEQLNYEWSQSFHIEFEFNWTKTTNNWEAIFHVTGPSQNADQRVPVIYQYSGHTFSFGIWFRDRSGHFMQGSQQFGNDLWKNKWCKFEMDAVEYYENSQMKTKVTVKVDDIVYVDFIHNNHIYELPANSAWVWVGDPKYPYVNPDFQMRRLYYGPRTEALKYGIVN